MSGKKVYGELHRPQFHFTAQANWLNDPNGLVFLNGEYHLFFQHNPSSVKWGNMTWGHAVSPDLVHWKQLDHAILPDELGTIFSGSAVVDRDNTAGFGSGRKNALVAFYTSAGNCVEPKKPVTQSLAYSLDRGRTWTKYAGNPVVGHIRADNRDPKVLWHEPTRRWIMALYLDGNDYVLLGSRNLKQWEKLCDVSLPDVSECPDFFELAVDGDPAKSRWVFWGAAGVYRLGTFDGTVFTPETGPLRAEYGANGYAAQTWSDIPRTDGRRIQVSWMAGGKYPCMPFNQQMSFPVSLTLRTFPDGVRLCRRPVAELSLLHGAEHAWNNEEIGPGRNLVPQTGHDLFRITGEVEPRNAARFGIVIRGITLQYDTAARKFTCLGREIPAAPENGRLALDILVDRTSLELFVNEGRESASFCFLPEACDVPIEFFAQDGAVRWNSLVVRELESAW